MEPDLIRGQTSSIEENDPDSDHQVKKTDPSPDVQKKKKHKSESDPGPDL